MRSKFALLSVFVLIWGCSDGADQKLTIADAEKDGFKKDSEKMFEMIGAEDGWSGKWAGEEVELYQYDSKEKVEPSVHEFEGQGSGWEESCQNNNMIMLSMGKNACEELRGLSAY